MYRQHENAKSLEKLLNELKKEYSSLDFDQDEERMINLKMEIEELGERINFAYQDEDF